MPTPVRVTATVAPLPTHQRTPAPVLTRPQAQGDVLATPVHERYDTTTLRTILAQAGRLYGQAGDQVEVLRHHWLTVEGEAAWAPAPEGTQMLGHVAVPEGSVVVLKHADHHADIALGGPAMYALQRQRMAPVKAPRKWWRPAPTAPVAPAQSRADRDRQAAAQAALRRQQRATEAAAARPAQEAARAAEKAAKRQRRAVAEAALRRQQQEQAAARRAPVTINPPNPWVVD